MICMVGFFTCYNVSLAETRNEKLRDIEALIDNGSLAEASRKLSELATAKGRTAEELVVRAGLESRGSIGADFLTAALKGAEFPRQREKIYLNLSRYYQALGNMSNLRRTLSAPLDTA